MNHPKEVSWTKLFAYDLPAPKKMVKAKCTCGNKTCQAAKKIRCTCRCHSEFHGASNREGMPKLDKLLQLDGLNLEAPAPLGLEWPFDEK